MKKTFMKKKEDVERKWYLVDAKGKTLGRLASRIATILRGKHKPDWTPHIDCGDYVIVINAKDVVVTGRKAEQKVYQRYSGYPDGLKEALFKDMIKKNPNHVIRHAVWGMLPKGRLGRAMFKKLKVFSGPEHEHVAQKPEILEV